jgi:hypothetical protein
LKTGHEQYVSTTERFQIIEDILNRKRERELDLSELDLSDERRAAKIEKPRNTTTRNPQRYGLRNPAVLRRYGFLDQRQRLTSRLDTIGSKPQMKLGIFNHFCKSQSVRMKTFDQAEFAKKENIGAMEFQPTEIGKTGHVVSKNCESSLAEHVINIQPLSPINSPLCELSVVGSAQDSQHKEKDPFPVNNDKYILLCPYFVLKELTVIPY